MSPLTAIPTGTLDYHQAVRRVRSDLSTDFIPAPHLEAIYRHGADDLVAHVEGLSAGGLLEPQLPLKMEIPKRSGLTRPGAILGPVDRLVYQAVADALAPEIERQTDRTRTFSHVLRSPDPSDLMFERRAASYARLTAAIAAQVNASGNAAHVIKADVANYYEHITQHNLINLLDAVGCDQTVTSLLERLLSAWTERKSYGIPQGMFPSDLFGNFFLTTLDDHYEMADLPSLRFVDDLYVFFRGVNDAREGMVDLCATLRKEGLHLNEAKSRILPAKRLVYAETALDRLFQKAHAAAQAVHGDQAEYIIGEAVAQGSLDPDAAEEMRTAVERDVETKAVEKLWVERAKQRPDLAERIERFCLPLLTDAASAFAVKDVLKQLPEKPHQARVYCRYLSRFTVDSASDLVPPLEAAFLTPSVRSDYQLAETSLALYRAPGVSRGTVTAAARIVGNIKTSQLVRALCALLVARHGTGAQRHNLRNLFADEPSAYVRLALIYAARYFPSQERATCLRSWGSQDAMSVVMASVVKKLS